MIWTKHYVLFPHTSLKNIFTSYTFSAFCHINTEHFVTDVLYEECVYSYVIFFMKKCPLYHKSFLHAFTHTFYLTFIQFTWKFIVWNNFLGIAIRSFQQKFSMGIILTWFLISLKVTAFVPNQDYKLFVELLTWFHLQFSVSTILWFAVVMKIILFPIPWY